MKYYLETELRTFDELSKEEKETVTKKGIESEQRMWEGDYVIEKFKETALEKYGFDVDNCYYSGFWSQGDGAMFEGYANIQKIIELNREYLEKHLSKRIVNLIYNGEIEIGMKFTHSGRYYHSKAYSNSFDFPYGLDYNYPLIYKKLFESGFDFESFVQEIYEDACNDLYKSLEENYDECTGEKIVQEYLLESFLFDNELNFYDKDLTPYYEKKDENMSYNELEKLLEGK